MLLPHSFGAQLGQLEARALRPNRDPGREVARHSCPPRGAALSCHIRANHSLNQISYSARMDYAALPISLSLRYEVVLPIPSSRSASSGLRCDLS